jgi:hypothetical protein
MTIEIDVTERPKPKLKPNPLLGVDPEKLALFKENFDIESVAKEGLSDEQVVPLIQAAFEGEIDFDKAREVTQGIDDDGNLLFEENGKPLMVPGYTNREIIQLFTKSSSKDIGGSFINRIWPWHYKRYDYDPWSGHRTQTWCTRWAYWYGYSWYCGCYYWLHVW